MNILQKAHQKQVNNKVFVLLLFLCAAAVAAYWWFSNREHPLMHAQEIKLCQQLPALKESATCTDSELASAVAGHSILNNKDGLTVLMIDVISTDNISQPQPLSTQIWFEQAIPEIKASGRQDIAEPVGPWRKALITRKNKQQELLFEDNGVVVILQSEVLDRNALIAYATQVCKTLRKAQPVKASTSPDAAKPQ